MIRRTLFHFGRTRTDMTPNCPERFDWEFLKYIWNYPHDHHPGVTDALRGFRGRQIVLQSPSHVVSYLSDLRAAAGDGAPVKLSP